VAPVGWLNNYARRRSATILQAENVSAPTAQHGHLWGCHSHRAVLRHQYISDYAFLIVMVLLAITGLAEFYGMAAKRELVCFSGWGIFGGALLMVGTFFQATAISHSRLALAGERFETGFLILFRPWLVPASVFFPEQYCRHSGRFPRRYLD